MDVLCSTAMRTRVDTGKKRVFHAFFLAGGCSTSELFNTQATLAKLFVRGASRAVASRAKGWSVKILSAKCLLLSCKQHRYTAFVHVRDRLITLSFT